MVRNNTCKCIQTLCKKCIWTHVCAPIQLCSCFFAMEAIANLSWVLREHRAGCCLLPGPLAGNLLRDAVRSRNPSKSTLAHDAVDTAVLHKHHLIIRVGAGLIQFFYSSHLRLVWRNRPTFDFVGSREKEKFERTELGQSLVLKTCNSQSNPPLEMM